MKILRVIAILFFLASAAYADLYQWKDREGVIHITDDLKKVPEAYRNKVKVFESTAKEKEREAEPPPTVIIQPPQRDVGEEIYGDYTLDWWRQTFTKRKEELASVESSVTAKRQYIDIFESGRRTGQIFEPTEIETYNRYKSELPRDQERLVDLRTDLDELRRRATIAGVPREVRD